VSPGFPPFSLVISLSPPHVSGFSLPKKLLNGNLLLPHLRILRVAMAVFCPHTQSCWCFTFALFLLLSPSVYIPLLSYTTLLNYPAFINPIPPCSSSHHYPMHTNPQFCRFASIPDSPIGLALALRMWVLNSKLHSTKNHLLRNDGYPFKFIYITMSLCIRFQPPPPLHTQRYTPCCENTSCGARYHMG